MNIILSTTTRLEVLYQCYQILSIRYYQNFQILLVCYYILFAIYIHSLLYKRSLLNSTYMFQM